MQIETVPEKLFHSGPGFGPRKAFGSLCPFTTDCSLCGEDMMQGQLKCQRCGRSTKENNDVQLFRAAKRRTQMLEEVSHRVGKTVDQLLINDFKG